VSRLKGRVPRALLVTWLCLGGAALVSTALMPRPGATQVVPRLAGLPATLAGLTGETQRFDEKIYKELDADETLLRYYTGPAGEALWLYIGYYGTRKGGRTGHMPPHCYPANGWEIRAWEKEPLALPDGRAASANKMLVELGTDRRLVLYWVHTGDNRVADSGWKMNLYRFARRVRTGRDDAAFVRLSVPVGPAGGDAALRTAKNFAARLVPELARHWPEEREAG